MKSNGYQCCICGKLFKGYGNNPVPVKPSGKCCDFCNTNIVIPARIAQHYRKRTPYEKTKDQVYATGNKWAIENFEATHN